MIKPFYDEKIIILDINFLDIAQYSLDEFLYTKKLLSELAANQNLILITDDSYFLISKTIEELGLKSGYLISDAGATLINIAGKNTIDEGFIDNEVAIQICRKCVWNNLQFSIITNSTKYPSNLSYWMINKYKSDLSHLFEFKDNNIKNSIEIIGLIEQEKIKKIEIYFLEREHSNRKKKMMEFVNLFTEDVNYSSNLSVLNIISNKKNKLQAVNRALSEINHKKLDLHKDSIYGAIGQCDTNLVENCYFPIITQEVNENKDFSNYQKIDSIEIIPWGNISWMQWFENNEHLWHGEQSKKLPLSLEKYNDYQISKLDLENIQNGNSKYLNIEKEVPKTFKNKFKKNFITTKKIKLSYWPQQIPDIVRLIKKDKVLKEKI